MLISFFVLVILIIISAFFALSEIAVITLNDKKIKKMAMKGDVRAIKTSELLDNSNDFLATIQVGITLSEFLMSATASRNFSEPIANAFLFTGMSYSVLESIASIVVTIILSYFSLVLGELVPKKIAMQYPEKISFKIAGTLLLFSKIFKPFVWLLSKSSDVVVRCFGMDPYKNEDLVTEEEILMMVDAGQERGIIEDKAKSMITNIFEFDDTTASEVMTPRVDIVAVPSSMTLSSVIDVALKNGRSRLPVYVEDIDNIVGIIYVKDALQFVNDGIPENYEILNLARKVSFVPCTKRCDELFSEFTSSKRHIAIVVDEYGGTEGLVTIEDLVESIVGNIQDEYDNEQEDVHKTSNGTFVVEGSTSISELEDVLDSKIPEGDYDTVAGFIIEQLGKVPESGEQFIYCGSVFKVLEVKNRRVTKVEISKEKV